MRISDWSSDVCSSDLENRLARAYLEELVSAEEAKKNAGRMRDKAHPSYVSANRYYKALKAEILERFPGTTPASLGGSPRTLIGQSLPNLEAAVEWMYDLTKLYGGTIRPAERRVGKECVSTGKTRW